MEDRGPGIKAENLPYIWDRYFSYRKTRSGNENYTGLGLAISKEILENHGASYGVDSQEGKGSLFYFELRCSYNN